MSISDNNSLVPQTPSERALFPCTPTQERSWFLNRLRREDSSYSIPVLWEIKGAFDAATIEEAFRIIVHRHEILRTRFVEADGEPMQEVLDGATFNLSVIDVSILTAAARQQRAWAICERESRVPFDISVPPLLRATLIRFHETHAQLLIVAHPSVFDGWSIGILGRELGEIIRSLRARRPYRLPRLALQYGDYALWHQEYVSKGGLEANARYWRDQLHDAPYFEVAPDHPPPEQRSSRSEVLIGTVDADLGDRVEVTAKASGVSFFVFGAAIIAAMLRGYTGQSDIVIGTQVAGRNDIDLEPLIGAFVNNLLLRFDTNGDRSFAQFVKDAADTVRDALVHQHMPFDHLVRMLNPRRVMSRMPLYSINVILQPAFMEDAHYGDFSLTSAPAPYVGSLTDLNFHMIKRPSGWRMTLEYNTELYERATAERMFSQWLAAMKLAVSGTGVMLSDFGDASRAGTANADVSRLPEHQEAPNPEGQRGNSDPAAEPQGQAVVVRESDSATSGRHKQSDPEDIEQRLIGIWRDILRTDNIDPDSNFFDLGGHSLSAMRMIARASAVLSVKVEPATFFKAPTIREFSRRFAEARTIEPWRIVPIQPRGSKPALIAINGATVYYNFYKTLSAKLGLEQPLFSVQPFDPRVPTELAAQSMEEIAAEYLSLVRKVSSTGPYIVMGHCVFGAIAFQVAQQLRNEGKTVGAVVMFDSWAPGYLRSLPWHHRLMIRVKSRIQVHKNRIRRLSSGEITIRDGVVSLQFVQRILRVLRKAGFLADLARALGGEDWFLWHAIRARDSYQPPEYDGDVILFVSDDCPKGRLLDPNLGWEKIVKGRLSIRRVGGTHMTMGYGPRGAIIAEQVQAFISGTD